MIGNAIGGLGAKTVKGVEVARGIWWIVMSIATGGTIAFSILILYAGTSQVWDATLTVQTWVIVSVFLILTNLFVLVREGQMAYDPWIDLRYHGRICAKLDRPKSSFLLRFHQTGFPEEMRYTDISTMNMIEQSVPYIVVFAGTGISLLIVTSTILVVRGSLGNLTVEDLLSLGGLIFAAILLLWLGLHDLIYVRWIKYRRWKAFWGSYWWHVMNCLEQSELGACVADATGSWYPIVDKKWWGELVDFKNNEFVHDLKKRSRRLMDQFSIVDTLPTDEEELIAYVDCLALFAEIRDFMEDNEEDLTKDVETSKRYQESVEYMEAMISLQGTGVMRALRNIDDVFALLPVANLSAEIVEEIVGLEDLSVEDRKEVKEWAEKRLDKIWALTESPIPDSLKWTGLFFSIASAVGIWMLPFF
jgi:hypothetical protein